MFELFRMCHDVSTFNERDIFPTEQDEKFTMAEQ